MRGVRKLLQKSWIFDNEQALQEVHEGTVPSLEDIANSYDLDSDRYIILKAVLSAASGPDLLQQLWRGRESMERLVKQQDMEVHGSRFMQDNMY